MECNKRTRDCVISFPLVKCYEKEVLVFWGNVGYDFEI